MDVLVLDTTSKSLRAVLGEAITTNQVDFTVHYGDVTSSGLIEGSAVSVSNGVTNVEILPVPAASTKRVVKNVTVHNSDTVTHNISLMLRNTATDYLLTKLYLLAGESWDFTEDGVPFLIPTKASAADINAGTDDVKFATAKAIKDSTNVPSVSPSTLGNVMASDGTEWVSSVNDGWIPDGNTWSYSSVDSPTGVISINSDVTGKIQKGMRLKYNQAQALTAYFPFDANSTSTVGSFTSTDSNTPTYTAGKFSNALTLVAASSQAVAITDTALMKPTGDFTIGCWFKSSTTATYQAFFTSWSYNPNFAGIAFRINNANQLEYIIGNNTGTATGFSSLPSQTTVTDGVWHYGVLTYKNNYAQLYLDGKLEASGYCVTPAYAATNYVRIGCQSNTGANTIFMNGQIDDLFLINGYALDEETIKAKYIAASAQGASDITVTKKAIVTNVGAWSGSATLITAYHGTDFLLANATITSPYYSNVKVPFGFNINPDKWMVKVTDSTLRTKASAVNGTFYYSDLGSINISVPIGAWNLSWQGVIAAGGVTGTSVSVFAGLSTANNSHSDLELTAFGAMDGASQAMSTYISTAKDKIISVSSKTPYYFTAKTTSATSPSILLYNQLITLVIRAICSYL